MHTHCKENFQRFHGRFIFQEIPDNPYVETAGEKAENVPPSENEKPKNPVAGGLNALNKVPSLPDTPVAPAGERPFQEWLEQGSQELEACRNVNSAISNIGFDPLDDNPETAWRMSKTENGAVERAYFANASGDRPPMGLIATRQPGSNNVRVEVVPLGSGDYSAFTSGETPLAIEDVSREIRQYLAGNGRGSPGNRLASN